MEVQGATWEIQSDQKVKKHQKNLVAEMKSHLASMQIEMDQYQIAQRHRSRSNSSVI